MTSPDGPLRLLPWTNLEGKPCYLSTDRGADSRLSQLADDIEDTQLGLGAEILASARSVLDDPASPHAELRYAGVRLVECLADALRVAESRGDRIPLPDDGAPTGPDFSPSSAVEAFGDQ